MNSPRDQNEPASQDDAQVALELDKLANRMCDGTLSAEELTRLEELLCDRPDLRDTYLSYLRVHADLMWQYRTGGSQPTLEVDQVIRPEAKAPGSGGGRTGWWLGKSLWAPAVLLVSAAMLGLAFIIPWRGPTPDGPLASAPAEGITAGQTHAYIATLRDTTGPFWTGNGVAMNGGSRVAAGEIRLDAGDAELVFDSGARLVLSGPTEMRLDSPLAAYLERGKVVAHMPPSAIGFEIKTATAVFVDQGTEFGLLAEPDGASELHVFRGQVDVHAANDAPAKQELLDGQAVRIERPGDEGTPITYSRARFGDVALRVVEPLQWTLEEGGNGHYYQLVVTEQPITWHEAARRASDSYFHGMPGHLATMTSAVENQFVVAKLICELPSRGVWMGLTDVLREGDFRWVTGEPLEYSNWATWPEAQPDNFREADWHGGEDYGMYTMFPEHQSWAWNDLSVDSMHETVSAYLVEYEPMVGASPHKSIELEPVEWSKSDGGNGNWYQLVLSLEPVTWEEVRTRAAMESHQGAPGQLVCLESEAERHFVKEKILRVCGIPEVMIGLSGSLRNNKLGWINGEPIGDLHVGHSHVRSDHVYGLLRWNTRKTWPEGWEVYSLSIDVPPANWFGYIVEYTHRPSMGGE